MKKDYQLLDSGELQKWERFGPFILQRPCPQAIWKRTLKMGADAIFSREEGRGWTFAKPLPKAWEVEIDGVHLKAGLTDFGHVGIFPEHTSQWEWLKEHVLPKSTFLNLFAYSGALSVMLAKRDVKVCHLDASKGMVDWAKENARMNGVESVRWIVDDAIKFLKREIKRGNTYEGIALDPPTFGRGSKGEVFKIEQDLSELVELCLALQPKTFLLTCHTPGFTPTVLSHFLHQIVPSRMKVETEELLLESKGALSIPSGSVAKAYL
ncbi:MAG TPA: class I SAM-dependent methyltransferase [Chlamydiales bacterium]|nr:class I SAM-dependent methyltransferase [Chlamydiales bacterium]